jgi:hypothetical protein
MVKLGYKLMSEEHGPADLVRNARRAEQAGFEFAAISGHCLEIGGARPGGGIFRPVFPLR